MQIICVSRGTFSGGKELAEKLAAKLGYDCLAREELTDAATRSGIPVGKLEMAVLRSRPLDEQLAVEKDLFKAFVTATLCERAQKQGVVYHGRTGHLILPGVTHVMRVRAIRDAEQRIASVMQRLDLSREKARKYTEDVDEDRRRWVRTLYNIDWHDPSHYDMVINLSHVGVENAAAALVSMSQLPEFLATPAAGRVVEDLLLASRCRLAIGVDTRTREMAVQVRAERGRVTVTYLPRQERSAKYISEILKTVEGVEEILSTMASTGILWIQERYDPASETLPQLLEIASKWNAAVELIQLSEKTAGLEAQTGPENRPPAPVDHGGILDDDEMEERELDDGLQKTRDRLITAGRAGGCRVVYGGAEELLTGIDRTFPYSLVVVGNVFLSKVESARKRLCRELASYLSDNLHVPVIGVDELKTQYLFGPRQWLRLLVFGALAFLLFFVVITHQEEVLVFLSREGTANRILSVVVLMVFVPIFAFIYGSFTRYLLRLFRFE
jgi:cytidylate kinase